MQNEFVVREFGSGTRIAMQRFFAKHGVQLKTSMEMPNNVAIKQAVAAGLGLGIISLHTLQQELALKQVIILQVEKCLLYVPGILSIISKNIKPGHAYFH